MEGPIGVLLAAFVLFFVKHFLFDFPFQTAYQLKNKGTYGHPGGLLHAGLHALGSIPAMLLFSPPLWLIFALAGGEFVVHYHVDWTKEQVNRRYRLTPQDFGFWQTLGIDQLTHYLSYAALAAILIAVTGPG